MADAFRIEKRDVAGTDGHDWNRNIAVRLVFSQARPSVPSNLSYVMYAANTFRLLYFDIIAVQFKEFMAPDSSAFSLDDKTSGAWVVHHTRKLEQVSSAHTFNAVLVAGKAGTLLSALSATEQTTVPKVRVDALAQAANINAYVELPKLLEILKGRKLIDLSASGVDVLGVTTPTLLQRTSEIFEELKPSGSERASLVLAEIASRSPIKQKKTAQFLSDTCKLSSAQTSELLDNAEKIGFVDYEEEGERDKVYFNGNLFRRAELHKIQTVLDSLTSDERLLVSEIEDHLRRRGCMLLDEVTRILGKPLFAKLNAVSMYDISIVSNDQENVAFVTRPAAFGKYGNPLIEDALDLAKAFVSSLTYGMKRSSHARGRIRMIEKLLLKLINGFWVGGVDAIGQDYRAIEMKRVIEVRPSAKGGYEMRLLKKEVGELALSVIKDGDASEVSLLALPGAAVTGYTGPETNRELRRKKQTAQSKRATLDIIMAIRTGGVVR
jgi:hypothetical protein